MKRLVLLLSVLLFSASVRAATVSIGDAQSDFSSGNYYGCLQKISSLLTSNRYPPASVERYDLLMLRGESLLMLKQSAAASAFDAAASVLRNKGDVPRVASAKALAVLVRASPKMLYKSKQSPAGPALDITNPDSRKQAMLDLFDARSVELQPRIDQALEKPSLVPIDKLLPAVWELYSLEFAATGSAPKTTDTVKTLGTHARKLIEDELNRLTARLQQLNDLASSVTITSNLRQDSIGYRGLTSPERDELQSIADELMKIQQVCAQGRRINKLLGGSGENWDALEADCADAKQIAEQAYERRY